MAVYVDPLMKHGGISIFRQGSCHMFADTLNELESMAAAIGMKRQWRQKSNSGLVHYDLTASKRKHAIKLGAVQIKLCKALQRKFDQLRAQQ